MTQFHVGEVIRKLRLQRGVTQAQLCDGICELANLSKIENGKHQPRRATLILLLQRLGVAEEQYYGLCSFDDLALEELKLAIRNANARFDYRMALGLLDKLMAEHECDTSIVEQFILWTQAINGKLINGEVVPYQPQEKLELLDRAIKCIVPNLDMSDIGQSLLGLDEVKIIMSIANVYSNLDQNDSAVEIYCQLLPYIETHYMNSLEKPSLIALITYNYSRALGKLNRRQEELEIAEQGIQICLEAGISRRLGELLMNKSCALQGLGRLEEGKDFAIKSYYFMKTTNRDTQAKTIEEYLYNEYGWSPNLQNDIN